MNTKNPKTKIVDCKGYLLIHLACSIRMYNIIETIFAFINSKIFPPVHKILLCTKSSSISGKQIQQTYASELQMEPDMTKTKLSQQTYLANRRVCSELAVTGGTYTQQCAHITLAKIQADQTKHMRNNHPSPVMIPGHLVPVLFPYHDSLFSHAHVRFFFFRKV